MRATTVTLLTEQTALELIARASLSNDEYGNRLLNLFTTDAAAVPAALLPWVVYGAGRAGLPLFCPRRVVAAWALGRLHEIELPA